MESTKLTFTRIRSKGDPAFYDPGSNIKLLLPDVMKCVLHMLEERSEGDPKLLKELTYLHNCFVVFQIRLAEDSASASSQLHEFFDAVAKASPKAQVLWYQASFQMLLSLYALLYRRDLPADGKAIKSALDEASLVALLANVDKQLRDEVQELKEGPYETFDPAGYVVCQETGEVLDNIKQLAGLFIGHTGPGDWHSLSEACDRAFMKGAGTREAQIALALAYPNYENLCVEVTDDTPGETGAAEEVR